MIKITERKTERLHGLDHLRTIAILLVMVFHYGRGIPAYLEPIKQIGWTGVDLFFVLSGYLIGFQLLIEYKNTNRISFGQFYIKRFFRIIPAYLAVLIMYYSLSELKEGSGLPPLWKFLTFTQNFGLNAQTEKSFSHAWSLCIEEQFYLLLPISIVLLFKNKLQKTTPYLIIGLIILGYILRLYNWQEHVQPFIDNGNRRQMVYGFLEKVYYPSYNRMDGLLMGLSIAVIFNYKPNIKAKLIQHGNKVLLAGLMVFMLAYVLCANFISYNTSIYGYPLISLAYAIIVLAAISPTCLLYKFKTKFTLLIATLSYSIYLTHKQVYHFTKMFIKDLGNESIEQWTFWICIIIAIVAGLLLHLIIEKPFLKLRDKLLKIT
ncbi:acyltransferase family protein [Saccharicrinis aurantiacus]|uniref:acyltransferase family protein n=1 Tax=Saccharicrinis aurantiacus TaxID=1849719 RepID=UPI000950097E|nr:acyltransferase [Saccharicrinis aurantiacus]